MEAVKSYRIQVEAPKDLIEEYFKVKQRALEAIFSHVKISKKAHLSLSREDRRKLRDELLKNWRFSKHYVDSAINSVIGLVKSWITLHNRGRAESKPEITKRTVYIKSTLFSFRDGILKISIEPNKRYLEVDLRRYDWIPSDFDRLGGLLMTEKELTITVKKNVEPKADKWASFDVNLTNITAIIDSKIRCYDLRELYHIHRVCEDKRRRIQRLSRLKPETSKRLLEKYSRREKNRAKDFMHKLTTSIAEELKEKNCGAIMERLKNIKYRILNHSKKMNRKLSKWNARTFQFMLEYKLLWNGLPVKYVNPKNSSKTCPLCSGSMASYLGRIMKCEECNIILDRDVVVVLNLQMRGEGFPQRALDEIIEGEGLSRNETSSIST
ncbi:MAG: transposase [Candidatus Brockarchaeota archaeon]|nr:transposase [Candidatus Brockarchaeota archaeon]